MPANLENSAVATGLEKVSLFSFKSQRRAMPNNVQNLQARLQQYMSQEHPDTQDGFRKDRGTRDQIANIRWIIEKARECQKKSTLYYLKQSTESL